MVADRFWCVGLVLGAALVLGSPAFAAPARIMSGEHDGFTRLVVIFDEPVDWALGRTADGYAFRVQGDRPDYDLAGAFNLIGRTRLAALTSDPETGDLAIGFACACHAEPFEFRPGTIVIDLKDGPPDEGASQESPLQPLQPLPSTEPARPTDPLARGLSLAWASAALKDENSAGGVGLPAFPLVDEPAAAPSDSQTESDLEPEPEPEPDTAQPLAPEVATTTGLTGDPFNPEPVLPEAVSTIDPALAALRDDLVREMSRGASEGVVDLALPKLEAPEKGAAPSQADISLEEWRGAPRLNIGGPEDGPGTLTAEGQACADDGQLDLGAWLATDRPIMDQIAEARAHLTGEFDKPDAEALRSAVRFHLAIGFGAEAIHLNRAFDVQDSDRPLWDSLGYIMDQREDPSPAFASMAACDTSAALWALLTTDTPDPEQPWNIPAIQRGFSALPPFLRKVLGPRVVKALQDIGAQEAGRTVRNSMERAGGEKTSGELLMEGEVALQEGDHAKAEQLLEPLASATGPESAEALVALVESRAAQGLPVSADTPIQIAAFMVERRGTADEERFRRAYVLALALSADFPEAFAESGGADAAGPDLWRLLSTLGTDEDLLSLAVLDPGRPAPSDQPETALAISRRLQVLGLPEPARTWYDAAEGLDPILGAQIALDRHDGLSALLMLQGAEGAEADPLRAAAHDLLGNQSEAAAILAGIGEGEDAARALARGRDWAALGQAEDAPLAALAAEGGTLPLWQTAASRLEPPATVTDPASGVETPPGDEGPLAAAAALASESEATRADLQALLDAVRAPGGP